MHFPILACMLPMFLSLWFNCISLLCDEEFLPGLSWATVHKGEGEDNLLIVIVVYLLVEGKVQGDILKERSCFTL